MNRDFIPKESGGPIMAYYFVVRIKMTDESIYDKYLEACGEVFGKYNGKYLAVDNEAEAIEGSFDDDRVVIIQFESRGDFEDWYYSEEYQDILKYRLEGAECSGVLVRGL